MLSVILQSSFKKIDINNYEIKKISKNIYAIYSENIFLGKYGDNQVFNVFSHMINAEKNKEIYRMPSNDLEEV